ncbi:MAG: XRE family transcriptional regulator [Thermomicrobiales bacterium]|jgi:transcriptional regulator with XRE-family HTH domain|nr:MAG: XRE family transcriptional regulator [Thermomicrobiales bacterium]
MSNRSVPTYPRYTRLAQGLGDRIRTARMRRRLTVTEMSERMGVTRPTLNRLEKGDLSVGLGVLVRALGVLGLDEDLAKLAADDELGRRLADSSTTTKRRRTSPA